jgi:hypothetical protein
VRSRRLIGAFALALGCLWPYAARADQAPPKLFLSCPQECFDAYLRQELSYFDFARDPYLADVTLVIVRQPAGSGGERFTVTLSRAANEQTSPASPSRSFVAPPGTPAHAARLRLAQTILQLLQAELGGTPHEAAFQLSLPPRDGVALSRLLDPWDYWVVAPELAGEGDGGSGYFFFEGTGALNARRITDLSKLRLRGAYQRQWSSFLLEDGSRVSGDVYGWESRALYAHSIGGHWALGGVAVGRGSQFENLRGHAHGGPLLEYNIFPYTENASQQLRFAYQAGAWANWYFEENVAGLLREARPYHALSTVADVNQPWGSIQWVGQLNSFIDEPELYRVSTGAIVSLRLFQGLAVSLEAEAAWVRDLISLRQRPVTDIELLLWTAQQRTDYTFEVAFAITYSFGSVHNTIVNPRFGRVDLEKE